MKPDYPYLRAEGLDDARIEVFRRFNACLIEGNARANLTAITAPEEVEVKHFLDSLCLRASKHWREKEGAPHIGSACFKSEATGDGAEPHHGSARIADVGGGAGFPGVPLMIADGDFALDVLEASRKKVDFIHLLANELGLIGLGAIHIRAEDAGRSLLYRERYDWTLSRGVAATPVLLEYCLPLLKIGGYMAAYKGPAGPDEAKTAKKAAALLGGKLIDVVSATLPKEMGERHILIYRKERPTPAAYPRKAGVPAKKPV